MKKIGHEVSFLKVNNNMPRNGEGTFLRLKDNSVIYVYTRFTGDSFADEAPSDLAVIKSIDDGESWSEPSILLTHDIDSLNYMCPSIFRLSNDDIGLVYLRKFKNSLGNVSSTIEFVVSKDECVSFSSSSHITNGEEYVVIENDHILITKSGRIILPVNPSGTKMTFYASDNDGKNWESISETYSIPEIGGLQETVVYEEESGRLRAFSRTRQYCQYECFSDDGGKTWSRIQPNTFFSSPLSPMMIRKIGNKTIAVWNPIPNYITREANKRTMMRTPLIMAVSENDGVDFINNKNAHDSFLNQQNSVNIYMLEDDPENGYCYPSIFDGGDYILVGYYHSDNGRIALEANKILKINISEL